MRLVEYAAGRPVTAQLDAQGFLTRVFGWMFLGLAVTGVAAAIIGSNDELLTTITESPWILIGLFVAQLALIKGYAAAGLEGDAEQRASILGALALYLDFINLFLFLLRIFGQDR